MVVDTKKRKMDTKNSSQNDLADMWWNKFEDWYEEHPVTRVLIVIDAILIAFIYLVLT